MKFEDQQILDRLIELLESRGESNHKMLLKTLSPMLAYTNSKPTLKGMLSGYDSLFDKLDIDEFKKRILIADFISLVHGSVSVQVENQSEPKQIMNANELQNLTLQELELALNKTPADALKYFKKKGIVLPALVTEALDGLRSHVFTVTGVARMDILRDFKDMLELAIKNGETAGEFKKQIKERLEKYGWLGKRVSDRPGQLGQIDSPWRLNMIYRTNLQSAYTEGRWLQMQDTAKTRPFVQCLSTIDPSTTKKCKGLHLKVFRFDDKYFARFLRAPGHFQCRRRERSLSAKNVKDFGLSVSIGTNFTQFKNENGFEHTDKGWQPDLTKYPSELVKRFRKAK